MSPFETCHVATRSEMRLVILSSDARQHGSDRQGVAFGEKPRAWMRAHRFALLRSWQKPRFLPAETKLMSEKAPQATFSNELGLRRGRAVSRRGGRCGGRGLDPPA